MFRLNLPRTEERRRDLKLLAFSLVVIAVAMGPLTEMLVRAWDTHGVIWQAVHGTTDLLSLDIDVAVVFPVGVYLGWLLLFGADRAKAIQPVLLLIAAGPFLLTLYTMGAWFEHVAWLAHLPALVLGMLVGFASGGGHRFALGNRVREFPRAAGALFVVAVGVCVAGFVQVHLLRGSSPGRFVVDLLATAAFLGMFGTFVQYTDRKDVLLVSPDRSAESVVLVGLYDAIESSMAGRVVEGRRGLIQARADLRHGNDVTEIRSAVRFRYRRSELFSRWISITADGYSTGSITERDLAVLRDRAAPTDGRFGGLLDLLDDISAAVSLGRAGGPTRLVDRIDDAAVVLLVVPLSDPDVAPLFDPDAEDPPAPPDYLTVYAELCGAFADDPDTRGVLTITDAEVVREQFEEKFPESFALDNPQFEHDVVSTLAEYVTGADEGGMAVDDAGEALRSGGFVALGRSEDDAALDGIDRLLEQIGR